jgi:transcriptional regulator with XRE-family HTH domain
MLSKLVKDYRKSNNLSQKQLAKILEIDSTYLSKIERDRTGTPPSKSLLIKIADLIGCDHDSLIYSTGRIDDLYPIFEQLAITYRDFLPFLRKLNNSPKFAREVFDRLEQKD